MSELPQHPPKFLHLHVQPFDELLYFGSGGWSIAVDRSDSFLIPTNSGYYKKELETAIITDLQNSRKKLDRQQGHTAFGQYDGIPKNEQVNTAIRSLHSWLNFLSDLSFEIKNGMPRHVNSQ